MMYPEITEQTRLALQQVADLTGRRIMFKEGICKGGSFLGCFDAYTEVAWRPDADLLDAAALVGKLRIDVEWDGNIIKAQCPPAIAVVEVVSTDVPETEALRRAIWGAAMWRARTLVKVEPLPEKFCLDLRANGVEGGPTYHLMSAEFMVPDRIYPQSVYFYARNLDDAMTRSAALGNVTNVRQVHGQVAYKKR